MRVLGTIFFVAFLGCRGAVLLFLHHNVVVARPFQVLSDVYAEELEAFDPLHFRPVDEDGVFSLLSCSQSMISSFVLVTFRERLCSWHQSARALTSFL